MTEANDDTPKFEVDLDWKAQARAEKEKLAQELDTPKIQVDDDWKAQAKAEKEKMIQEQAADEPVVEMPASEDVSDEDADEAGQEIQADFEALVSTIASTAMAAMGGTPDPYSGRRVARLDAARLQIDLLDVLKEKTEGNLTEDEGQMLLTVAYELRSQYIRVSQMAIRQLAGIQDPAEAA